MRAQPVEVVGGFYTDDSLPWSCQDTVNWLPTRAEVGGTLTPWKLETCPGLRESLWLGDGSAPIRGMHDLEGQLYFVSGQTLYRLRTDGAVDALGLIPGVGRVSMTHNQFKTGYQLLVENGQGGGGYVYSTSDSTFTKITDEGYPGSISSDYLDQYMLGVEPQGRFWFHSNLADATDYNTLDRYEAESAPDRIVGLASNASEVVVFGQRTTEFYFNSGAATGTFQNRRSSITRGCASRHTIQKLDNSVFWLGDDGIVYRLDGYSARRISTQALEKAIAGLNWSEAVSYVWEDRGYKVYYLTFPDGQTFGNDVVTGLWTRRQSFGLDRWRLSHVVRCNGHWYGGDFQSGRLWIVDWDYYLEGQAAMVRRHVTGVLHDNQSQMIIPNAELIIGTGTEPTVPLAPLPPVAQFPGPPMLTGTLVAACAGSPYNATLSKSGGAAPTTIRKSAGPVDLTISDAGVLNWPAPQAGTFNIVAQIRDAVGRSSQWQGQLVIKPLTWDFTTWQAGGAYASAYGAGRVIWSSHWQRFISCTGPGRKISTDGITWVQNGTGDFLGVAENPNTFRLVCAQNNNQVYTSDDGGATVILRATKPDFSTTSLRFVNGQFTAMLNAQMTIGGADGVAWTDGPTFVGTLGVRPAWEFIEHLGIYLFVQGFDGTTGTSTNALGPYTLTGTIPGWSGNTAVTILYVKRTRRTFILTSGLIRERLDNGTYVTRLSAPGLALSDVVDIPEMGAIVAVGSGGQPSTAVSVDGGTTWTRYNGLNSFRLLAWSPPLGRLVAIGQNIASYANATCVL